MAFDPGIGIESEMGSPETYWIPNTHNNVKSPTSGSESVTLEKTENETNSCHETFPKQDSNESFKDLIIINRSIIGPDLIHIHHPSLWKDQGQGSSVSINKPTGGIDLCWTRSRGILFTILSTFMSATINLVVKLLTSYHPLTLNLWRYGGMTLVSLAVILIQMRANQKNDYLFFGSIWPIFPYKKVGDLEEYSKRKETLWNLLKRGTLGFLTSGFIFGSLQYLTVTDVTLITQCSPVFVFILAFFCLKEACNAVSIFSAILSFVAVFILTRPPLFTGQEGFNTDTLIGLGLAQVGLLCLSSAMILTRQLREVHYIVVLLSTGIIGTILSLTFTLGFQVLEIPKTLEDWSLCAILVTSVFLEQYFTFLALKYEEAGIVSIVKVSSIFFAVSLEVGFLPDELPDEFTIIGGFIILLIVTLTFFKKWVGSLPEESGTRKKCWIILL